MSALKIVSWNINSVRLRAPNVIAFAAREAPDVICLQETKCRAAEFPAKAFSEAGYPHVHAVGQGGGHHGVAIVSRRPMEAIDAPDLCREGHARVASVRVEGLEIHNIYLPAGGDVPDRSVNAKFDHKLDFLARMAAHYKQPSAGPLLLAGDLNVAPHENDVWSHKQLLKIVSHTPVETEALEAARAAGSFTDLARASVPEAQKLYTWWSYRARDWAASNRGRRLDHLWACPKLAPSVDLASFQVHLAWRGGWKPSDHAPISVKISP
ncbi:MAG: exodeoxyribonuclease III [Pseudomonadota bacterium]